MPARLLTLDFGQFQSKTVPHVYIYRLAEVRTVLDQEHGQAPLWNNFHRGHLKDFNPGVQGLIDKAILRHRTLIIEF